MMSGVNRQSTGTYGHQACADLHINCCLTSLFQDRTKPCYIFVILCSHHPFWKFSSRSLYILPAGLFQHDLNSEADRLAQSTNRPTASDHRSHVGGITLFPDRAGAACSSTRPWRFLRCPILPFLSRPNKIFEDNQHESHLRYKVVLHRSITMIPESMALKRTFLTIL